MPKYRVKRHSVTQPSEESYRLIPLTQGQNAIVDVADFEWLNQWNWFARWDSGTKSFYAARNIPSPGRMRRQTSITMNAEILGCLADHRNHDTLDNRRQNLRKAEHSDNQANGRKRRNNTSGFIGVGYYKRGNHKKRWNAHIYTGRRHKHLGVFASAEEAARARDKVALELHGEFAVLNFPLEADGCTNQRQ